MTSFIKFFNNRDSQVASETTNVRSNRARGVRPPMKPRRLMTETLEERQLLAIGVLEGASAAVADTANIINISSNAISVESIRQAIAEAAATPEDDVIRIEASSLNFTSANDEIVIDVDSSTSGAITIVAVGGDVNIDANSYSRVFSVKNGDVVLQGLNLTNGSSEFGGAIANAGVLTIVDVTLSGNTATVGGAIANSGVLNVQDSVIVNNTSAQEGAAIYEGDFEWPTAESPKWENVPDQIGSKGTTLSVNLADYINAGSWTYSYSIAETTSVILASDPTLSESGVLSFTFIDDDDYYGEDDYSALSVTVTVTDGVDSDSATFTVSLAEQTSVTLAAVLSNMTYDDATGEYVQGSVRRPTGYAADEIPSPSIVDVTDEMTVQVWLQDYDWTDYSDKVWDAGDFVVMGVEYRIHLENATITEYTDRTALCRSAYVYKDLGNGDYEFIIAYTSGANFGYEEALLLDVLTIEAVDTTKPVSATIYQINRDWTYPCYTRLYETTTPRDETRSHINVDPSQTLFVSTISNSTTPLSAVPGESFNENISRAELDDTTVGFSDATLAASRVKSTTVSNSLIAKNVAGGDGVIYADGSVTLNNVTVADNAASGAALYIEGTTTVSAKVANSIIVNSSLAPISGGAAVSGSLVNGAVAGATTYQGGALFNDAANGDYSLAAGSEAINLGSDADAVDYTGAALTTDLAGAARSVSGVDAGAYEYQGVAPIAPTNLSVSDYFESGKKPVLSWTAPADSEVDGYYVYLIDGATTKLLTTLDAAATSYADIATSVPLADNQSYVFGVAAFNAFGVSATVTTTLVTAVAPAAPTNLAFGEYSEGSVELSWNAADGAASYNVESLNASGVWTVVASTTNLSTQITGLADFVTYTYRVSAVNEAGATASESISISTVGVPDAPTGLKWSGKYSGDGTMTLVWNAVDNARGYVVYMKVDDAWTRVATVGKTSYVFTGLADNASYEISVAAYAKDDSKVYYSDATEISLKTTIAPAAPDVVEWAGEYAGDGTATLNWSAVENAYAYSIAQYVDGTWTEIRRTYATTLNVTGLENNTEYVYGVAAYTMSGSTRYYSDYTSVRLNTIVAPSTPTAVHFAEYSGGNSAALSWSAVTGATGYLVEILNESNVWETVVTTTETSYTATVEPNSYYQYRVSAYTTVGDTTLSSATVAANLDTLVAPTGTLVVSAAGYVAAAGTATVSWNGIDNASYYVLYEKVADGEWTVVESYVDSTSFVATGLEANTNYSFRVVAANAAGTGAVGETTLFTSVVPATPADVAFGELDAESKSVTLSWSAVDFATGYLVESYDETTQAWSVVSREDETALSYVVTNVENFGTYTYRVSAYNAVGTSQPTTVVFENTGVPSTPTNLTAKLNRASLSVNLSWDLMTGATGYYVYQLSGVGSTWQKIGNLSSISHVYTVQNLAKNAEYVFAVSAYNAEGESGMATIIVSTKTAPATPTNVAFGELDAANTGATLSWSASEGADGYLVELKDGDEWTTVASLDSAATSWTVAGLEESTTYTYRVSAFNNVGSSETVEVVLTTGTQVVPAAPTDFVISNYNEETRRATMTWTDNASNETGYDVQYSYDGVDWISAATLSANATTRVANGLTPGKTYYFRVAAFNAAGYSDWATVAFDVPAEGPDAPTDLVFGDYDASSKSVEFTWTDNSDDELGFRVQYSLDQTEWYAVETTEANVTSHIATGLVEGRTYYFRVAAYNLYGVSEWTTGSFTVPVVKPDAPAAPSDIAFSDAEFTTSGVNVSMSWTDNSDNETRFVVQFSYDNTNWYGAGSTDANVTTRLATGLVEGRTYYFRVAAYNDSGYSEWTTASYLVPSSNVNTPSEIVFGEYSNGSVAMSWTDNSDNELGFVVQFSYDGVNWHRAGTTDANVTTRVATQMTPGRLYYFRVAAYNSTGYSDWTVAQYTTPSGAPAAPGDIVFSDYSESNHTVKMTWGDESADEVGFNVQYSVDGGNTWLTSGNTSANVNARTATGLRVGVTYSFRVRSFNSYGASGWTYGSFNVPASENAPAAPTDFTFGEYDSDARTLSMSWTDVATNETGYKVQYSVDGGTTWYSAGSYGANVTSRVATSVAAGRTYMFRVAAYNADGASAWLCSDEYYVSASVNVPAAPSDVAFSGYNAETRSVQMSWTDNATNEKGFKVEYSVDGGETWIVSAYLAADVTSREVTGLVPGKSYAFRVAAYNNYGTSDWAFGSYSVVVTEEVPAPTAVAFTYSSTKRTVVLNWSGDAASYNVQYRLSSSSDWYALNVNGKTASLSGVTYGSSYYFRLQAVAEDGSLSEWAQTSYDTKTGGEIVAEAKLDVFEEAFKDYFDEEF